VDVIDHIHLAAPDQAKGVDWYHTHFGATPVNVDSTVTALKAKNIKVTTEPRPLVLPSGTAMHTRTGWSSDRARAARQSEIRTMIRCCGGTA
jgi:hypothetical protein